MSALPLADETADGGGPRQTPVDRPEWALAVSHSRRHSVTSSAPELTARKVYPIGGTLRAVPATLRVTVRNFRLACGFRRSNQRVGSTSEVASAPSPPRRPARGSGSYSYAATQRMRLATESDAAPGREAAGPSTARTSGSPEGLDDSVSTASPWGSCPLASERR